MALQADQRQFMLDALHKAIAAYYGDKVPTLKEFTNKKRATFLELLEKKLNVADWRERIADKQHLYTAAKSAVTKLDENYSAKKAEYAARFDKEMAELRAKQNSELAQLAAHYEPDRVEARQRLEDTEKAYIKVVRESYFAGLEAQDDGRGLVGYRSDNYDIDRAVRERVDQFIADHLMDDEDGKLVKIRMSQEENIGIMAYIAKDVEKLRSTILGFIKAGKLPQITIEAWGIENGVDVLAEDK